MAVDGSVGAGGDGCVGGGAWTCPPWYHTHVKGGPGQKQRGGRCGSLERLETGNFPSSESFLDPRVVPHPLNVFLLREVRAGGTRDTNEGFRVIPEAVGLRTRQIVPFARVAVAMGLVGEFASLGLSFSKPSFRGQKLCSTLPLSPSDCRLMHEHVLSRGGHC